MLTTRRGVTHLALEISSDWFIVMRISRKLTPETDANHKTASPQPIRRISSQTLLGPDGKLIIDHDGQEYLLRKTQAGKLLLTK